MPLHELIQLVGPYVSIVFLVVTALLAMLKVVVPKFFDALIGRLQSREAERVKEKEHARLLETEAREAGRQEERALLTQMVELQSNIIAQNEALLKWVTEKVSSDLQEFAQETQVRCAEAKAWGEKAARQMIQNQGQMQLVQMELSSLIDAVRSQTERFASIAAYYDGTLEEWKRSK